jgi:hypothetical protein
MYATKGSDFTQWKEIAQGLHRIPTVTQASENADFVELRRERQGLLKSII